MAVDTTVASSDPVESLERELRELRNLETARSEFLAAVSHELRTPLTAVLTYAEALEDGVLGELSREQADAVGSILRATRQSLDMVDDLLRFSRSGGEGADLSPASFEVRELVREIRTTHESLLRSKGLEFRTDLDEDLPPAYADRTKAAHVLGNLLANAIEFTPEGGRVEVRARSVDTGDWLRIEVVDTGVGIAPEDQERIFEEFVTLDDDLERTLGGTGLGLAIARRIVRMHGGRLGVESAPGQGSRFHFTLPTARNRAVVERRGEPEPGPA
ncbi:MAG TPA: HAMP domain-containing sensor histidine kinase [Longimicrobiales bacterium]|nr:HAMP domain-containing sensor histidine kinase [Longimicrobiales bacterium]